jgi:hypothetical protein
MGKPWKTWETTGNMWQTMERIWEHDDTLTSGWSGVGLVRKNRMDPPTHGKFQGKMMIASILSHSLRDYEDQP